MNSRSPYYLKVCYPNSQVDLYSGTRGARKGEISSGRLSGNNLELTLIWLCSLIGQAPDCLSGWKHICGFEPRQSRWFCKFSKKLRSVACIARITATEIKSLQLWSISLVVERMVLSHERKVRFFHRLADLSMSINLVSQRVPRRAQ